MKITKLTIQIAAAILAVLITTGVASAQTNLNFNSVTVNAEGAIKLSWNTVSNETYEIDEADALNTNSDGTTIWNILYKDYPSQGSNTYWLDTGNYIVMPNIVHPKYAQQRYYRIKDLGLDGTSD
jgi:hypothetical protein